MITDLMISNFKKFNHLYLKDLSHINLFVGSNNVGKTSLLEAIFAFACGENIDPFLSASVFRRLQTMENRWLSPYPFAEAVWNTFHDKKNINDWSLAFNGNINGTRHKLTHRFRGGTIFSDFLPNETGSFGDLSMFQIIEAHKGDGNNLQQRQFLGIWETQLDNKEKCSFSIQYPLFNAPISANAPLILATMNDILTHRNETDNRRAFSFVSRAGLLPKLIKEMNHCFDGEQIVEISSIPYPDGSAAPISIRFANGHSYPLYALGDGMRRWFYLIGSMLVYKNAVHCIEEIEATIHHQAQEDLSYNLCKYARKYGNQLFITTHSQEYLQAFLSSVKEHEGEQLISLQDDIRVITLRNVNHAVRVRVLNGSEAAEALASGLELRV